MRGHMKVFVFPPPLLLWKILVSKIKLEHHSWCDNWWFTSSIQAGLFLNHFWRITFEISHQRLMINFNTNEHIKYACKLSAERNMSSKVNSVILFSFKFTYLPCCRHRRARIKLYAWRYVPFINFKIDLCISSKIRFWLWWKWRWKRS